ncbi:hypothetical protein [Bilophila wadsworthia]|uniref:hypothetical protein n=1 Tax=Bilophila wadsworthia TaxID=35833 RepID=UPI00399D08DD
MDEANMEADGGQQERQAKNEKLWKAYPPETYRNTIAELVHFSSKTVNSNAALGVASLRTMLWMPLMSRPVR